GILAAGGAYVPLDPRYPAPRLALQLDDTRAAVLLTQTSLRGLLPAGTAPVLLLDGDAAPGAGEPVATVESAPPAGAAGAAGGGGELGLRDLHLGLDGAAEGCGAAAGGAPQPDRLAPGDASGRRADAAVRVARLRRQLPRDVRLLGLGRHAGRGGGGAAPRRRGAGRSAGRAADREGDPAGRRLPSAGGAAGRRRDAAAAWRDHDDRRAAADQPRHGGAAAAASRVQVPQPLRAVGDARGDRLHAEPGCGRLGGLSVDRPADRQLHGVRRGAGP